MLVTCAFRKKLINLKTPHYPTARRVILVFGESMRFCSLPLRAVFGPFKKINHILSYIDIYCKVLSYHSINVFRGHRALAEECWRYLEAGSGSLNMYIQGARQMFLTYIQSEGWIFTTGNRHGGVGNTTRRRK